ncbi:hypothetical protein BDL97_03G141700 [Sphagnum fallax]|nr:hypothetical protein BDL97_03G141700 [Sphagnum fallax]
MTPDEAVALIQAEERGRQSRKRIVELTKIKAMQETELERQRAGIKSHTKDSACGVMQCITRGFNARLQTERTVLDELTLIHMNNFIPPDPNDPQICLQSNLERRKKIQEANKLEETNSMMDMKQKIIEIEGQEMREIMQERINVWLNENRDPDTNFYPPYPRPAAGGSKDIIDPPPELWRPEDEKKKKKGEDSGRKKKKKPGKMPIRMPLPDEDADLPPMCPNYFGRHIQHSIESYLKTWHDKDDFDNHEQTFIPEILKNTLRPLVFEEVRLNVDVASKELILQLKKKLARDKKEAIKIALKQAKKEGREKEFKAQLKAEKQQAKKDRIAKAKAKKEAAAKEPPPPEDPTKKKKPKRKKDKTEKFSVESLFTELVKEGILQVCPKRTFDEYICEEWLQGVEQDPIKAWGLDNSMAQAKRLTIEYTVLPLASQIVNENAPFVRSLLLHGAPKTGKTLLAHAACQAAGATFLNLSASVIDGKYPGAKNINRMLQISFKIAKIMAPSMIYIEDVDQVFVTDKKKMKAYGLKDKPNRIKKGLTQELKAINPGERVIFVGTTSKPQNLQGKKGPTKATANFCKFFTKRIYTPYPDHGALLQLWRGLLERHGAVLDHHFNVSILATLSANYSIGDIEEICKLVLTTQRIRKMKRVKLEVEEVMDHLYKFNPIDPALLLIAKNFGKDPQPVAEDPNDKKKKQLPEDKNKKTKNKK